MARLMASRTTQQRIQDESCVSSRTQILSLEATFIAETEFGTKYQIRGRLIGPNRIGLPIISIWLVDPFAQQTKFVTLFPNKEE